MQNVRFKNSFWVIVAASSGYTNCRTHTQAQYETAQIYMHKTFLYISLIGQTSIFDQAMGSS